MSAGTAPRIAPSAAHPGFGLLLQAEWTKLRTVRAWVATALVAAIVMVLFSWLVASGNHAGICSIVNNGKGSSAPTCTGEPALPIGPGGEAVADTFTFVHQPLTGNGSITVRVTSFTGVTSAAGNHVQVGSNPFDTTRPELAAWAKAGLLVTPSLVPGSAYAAVMVTGAHGVRMQDDYTHDTAGPPGEVSPTSPRWLRLSRVEDTLTGAESTDGTRWTTVGTAQLAGLPSTVQVGLFVTSPTVVETSLDFEPTYATAAFDHVDLGPAGSGERWTTSNVGGGPSYVSLARGRSHEANGRFTVGGSGDIAPAVHGTGASGSTGSAGLVGAFAAIIVVAILGALFITSEYRRGLIRTTFAATPARGRVLAAKAVVIAAATFVPALVGATAAVALSRRVLTQNGNALYPIRVSTEIRVIVGTAALVAVAAVLALALGTILRRAAGAVTLVVAVVVVPYILALTPPLSGGLGEWLMRLTPASGFAIQQELTPYAQVANAYTPVNGYYPFGPWGGFAVLCAWTALALAAAALLLRRRDA